MIPEAQAAKGKNRDVGLHETKNLLYNKGSNLQSEETIYRSFYRSYRKYLQAIYLSGSCSEYIKNS